jgi:hypothetical protein
VTRLDALGVEDAAVWGEELVVWSGRAVVGGVRQY